MGPETAGLRYSRAAMAKHSAHILELAKVGPSFSLLCTLVTALECTWSDVLGAPPGANGANADWEAGYRAGLGDAAEALRNLAHTRSNGQ